MAKTGRVFILGAGFSHSHAQWIGERRARVPLVRSFFREMIGFISGLKADQPDAFRQWFRIVYLAAVAGGDRSRLADRAWLNRLPGDRRFLSRVNVEDLLPFASSSYALWRDLDLAPDRVRRRLLANLRSFPDYWVRAIGVYLNLFRAGRRSAISRFARNLRPGDVILTFNWDNLLEQACMRLGLAVRYHGPAFASGVVLLKLHGSVDWLRLEKRNPFRRTMLERLLGRVWRITDYPGFMDRHAVKYVPLIVPPVAAKTYTPELRGLWRDAVKALIGSSRVVVIGYSLPQSDHLARALMSWASHPEFSRGWGRSVEVVDPCKQAFKRVREALKGRGRIVWIPRRFEESKYARVVRNGLF